MTLEVDGQDAAHVEDCGVGVFAADGLEVDFNGCARVNSLADNLLCGCVGLADLQAELHLREVRAR